MPLTLRVGKDESAIRIQVAGSLDSTTAPMLESELKLLLDGPESTIVLDLAELTFVASAGIRVILAARRHMTGRGGALLLVNVQPPVAKAFEIIRAIPGVGVFKDVAELDAYLAIMQRKVREQPPRKG